MKFKESGKQAGFSLIEVMIATLVLIVLIIGGAAVLSKAGGGIQQQQNKREALVAADAVMESFWNLSYQDLKDDYQNKTTTTNVVVNGRNLGVAMTVGQETADYEGNLYLELRVSIRHSSAMPSEVFVTRRYEFGISRASL